MKFDQIIKRYRKQYDHGSFLFSGVEQLQTAAQKGGTPNKPGVYVVYGVEKSGKETLMYIGRAGTIRRDGSFKRQKLIGRISRGKQCKISRRKFYVNQMEREKLSSLRFVWFVVHDKNHQILPAKAEAELMQAYYEQHRELPLWNCSF